MGIKVNSGFLFYIRTLPHVVLSKSDSFSPVNLQLKQVKQINVNLLVSITWHYAMSFSNGMPVSFIFLVCKSLRRVGCVFF